MKSEVVKFNICEGTTATVMASFNFSHGKAENVKIITKVPRGHYYGFLNDALSVADTIALTLWDNAAVACRAHNPKVTGSIPVPATEREAVRVGILARGLDKWTNHFQTKGRLRLSLFYFIHFNFRRLQLTYISHHSGFAYFIGKSRSNRTLIGSCKH